MSESDKGTNTNRNTYRDWLAKYYPETAGVVASRNNRIEIIEHSLNKWKGCTKTELDKYGITRKNDRLYNEGGTPILTLNYSTCALCDYSTCKEDEVGMDSSGYHCDYCPVTENTGDTCNAVWEKIVCEGGRSSSMVKLLEKTLKVEQSKMIESE